MQRETKRCPRCETVKPRSSYRLRPGGRWLESLCLDCDRARLRLNARRRHARKVELRGTAPPTRCSSPLCPCRGPGLAQAVPVMSLGLWGLAKLNSDLQAAGHRRVGFLEQANGSGWRVWLDRKHPLTFRLSTSARSWSTKHRVKLIRLPGAEDSPRADPASQDRAGEVIGASDGS